jgi:hypothetical protein
LEEIIFENFNIPENNIISVELAKVVGYITCKFLLHLLVQVTNYTASNLQHQSGLSGSISLSYSLMDLVTTKFSITSQSCSEDSQHVNIPNNIPKVVCIYAPQKKYQESLRPLAQHIPHKTQAMELTNCLGQKSSCCCHLD